MGREAKCFVRFGSQAGEGKALLETNEVLFRGPFRFSIPLKEITALEVTKRGLEISTKDEVATFELGEAEAAKWFKAIREPKSVLDKLGVKAGHRVSVLGLEDAAFLDDLKGRSAEILATGGELDHLFFAVASTEDLPKLKTLKQQLKPNGALWLLRPKGRKDLTEVMTMAAGKAAGLVDVKVVGFSEMLSAEKYVIPLKDR
jgi:hypothetical protein